MHIRIVRLKHIPQNKKRPTSDRNFKSFNYENILWLQDICCMQMVKLIMNSTGKLFFVKCKYTQPVWKWKSNIM